ncbi:MAG: hypothetical protein FWF79_04100 [Defluviitaleaceae bacterium]|nr:hypothetical protein [Defluviitaleaceae bacterium]
MSTTGTKIKLLETSVSIQGEYFTVNSGFISKVHGKLQLYYKDLIAVELVKRRSKKLMYVVLFLSGILMFLLNFQNIFSVALIFVFVILICAIGVIYFLSIRQFLEITSMKGTYRIAVKYEESEVKNITRKLQCHTFDKC